MKRVIDGKEVAVSQKDQAKIRADWAENDRIAKIEEAERVAEEAERAEIAAALNASDSSEIVLLRAEVKAMRRAMIVAMPTLAEAAPLVAVEAITKKRKK